jgi:hypothetical protein
MQSDMPVGVKRSAGAAGMGTGGMGGPPGMAGMMGGPGINKRMFGHPNGGIMMGPGGNPMMGGMNPAMAMNPMAFNMVGGDMGMYGGMGQVGAVVMCWAAGWVRCCLAVPGYVSWVQSCLD